MACPNCKTERSALHKMMFMDGYCVRCPSNPTRKELQNMKEENEMLKKKTEDMDAMKKSLEELEEENKRLEEVVVELRKFNKLLLEDNASLKQDREDVENSAKEVISLQKFSNNVRNEDFCGKKLDALEYLKLEEMELEMLVAMNNLTIERKRRNLKYATTEEQKKRMETKIKNDEVIQRSVYRDRDAKLLEFLEEWEKMNDKLDKENETVEEAERAKEEVQEMRAKLEKMKITEQENVKKISELTAMIKELNINAAMEKTNADENMQILEAKLKENTEKFEDFKRDQERLREHAEIEKKMQEKTIDKLFDENLKRAGESKLQEYLFNELQGKYNALKADMVGSA